jgi:hypothetical protein
MKEQLGTGHVFHFKLKRANIGFNEEYRSQIVLGGAGKKSPPVFFVGNNLERYAISTV